jgi:hypothetical protein
VSLVDDCPTLGTAETAVVADGVDDPVAVDGAGVVTLLAEQGGFAVARVGGRRRYGGGTH